MEFIKHIRGYQRILMLTFTVFFLTITFETSQQLYYIKRFNLGDDVTYFFLLKSQAYRWLIWVLLSGFIFWYLKSRSINQSISINTIIKYSGLILGLTAVNIFIISISQFIVNGDTFTVQKFTSDYLQFFMFQKAPMYILGYIAITIIIHLYVVNEQLQVKVQHLSELKTTNSNLYKKLKEKMDDRTSV